MVWKGCIKVFRNEWDDVCNSLLSGTEGQLKDLPGDSDGKNFSQVRVDPLEKEMATTPVFLPGEFHRQRSLVSYSPWGRKESDTTEQLTHTQQPNV